MGETEKAIADYQRTIQVFGENPTIKCIRPLIGAAEGLTRLGIDCSQRIKQYKALAVEKGWEYK